MKMKAHSKLKRLQPYKAAPPFQAKQPKNYAFEKHRYQANVEAPKIQTATINIKKLHVSIFNISTKTQNPMNGVF